MSSKQSLFVGVTSLLLFYIAGLKCETAHFSRYSYKSNRNKVDLRVVIVAEGYPQK